MPKQERETRQDTKCGTKREGQSRRWRYRWALGIASVMATGCAEEASQEPPFASEQSVAAANIATPTSSTTPGLERADDLAPERAQLEKKLAEVAKLEAHVAELKKKRAEADAAKARRRRGKTGRTKKTRKTARKPVVLDPDNGDPI